MPEFSEHLDQEKLSQIFRRFGELECKGASPLYETLSLSVAEDEDLLALASHAQKEQPVPNMLFAGAQALLLKGQSDGDALKQFYPNFTDTPLPPTNAFPVFRSFCLDHAEAIQQHLQTRLVQTNEVGRCVCIWPAIADIGARHDQPLALVEMGASAGLNLLGDQYAYQYDEDIHWGEESPVQLHTELRGEVRPPLPNMPAISQRIGVDLNPVHVTNEEDMRWLQALIWPENIERHKRLKAAVQVALENPPTLIGGDVMEQLPAVLEQISEDVPLVAFHSFSMNQWPHFVRDKVAAVLDEAGQTRPLYRLSLEAIATGEPQLERTQWANGVAKTELLATCEPHGRWLEWNSISKI